MLIPSSPPPLEKLQNELNSLDALAGLSSVLSVPDQEESVLDMALQAVSVLLEQGEPALVQVLQCTHL